MAQEDGGFKVDWPTWFRRYKNSTRDEGLGQPLAAALRCLHTASPCRKI